MWTMACSISPQYASLLETFYARARKYAELDELRGHGESMITLAHAQCWELLATFEFKMMFFPRAWMSCGRATRLSQMMALHRQDGVGLDVKQCLPPARDWTEREERRRTFWMAFCNDRYASIGTGWPFTIDEKDVSMLFASATEFYQSICFPDLDKSPSQRRGIHEEQPRKNIPIITSHGLRWRIHAVAIWCRCVDGLSFWTKSYPFTSAQ